MQHYFIEKTASINDQIILDGEIAHRIVKVRRSQVSDEIELVDAEHNAYVAVIMALKGNEVLVKVVREAVLNPELPVSSTIVVGTSKGDKNEFIIQKATEMGVQHIIFFNADYSISRIKSDKIDKKLSRYQKIAQQAAEQSRRENIPTVRLIDKLSELSFTDYDTRLIAYEEAAKQHEHSALREALTALRPSQRIIMVFGPEGGISPLEIGFLESKQFKAAALGNRILRVETAPLYFLSALSYQLEMS
ncbi:MULTISPECIES: RsmE family RNA methyltransferase [Amylolactobacillus]|nr:MULTISPECIES: RsmE family RNA methyltransferase [Amylolactobacillus]APT17842.1 hypothetical protein LA20533_00210 [Amylolactobacillus amylophilus DSM 20533 = JCM 1125]APT19260.1 hypothetical protein LA20533_08380 [Amylolactobacillus amylophilus DSM 20533 = JCM 1125]GED79762.1 ribosomal RNA small subunit methyltransferase E [Amylolactobacillus amylophilus]